MTDEPTVEQTYARLQEMVTKLERGDLGLEATVILYREALASAQAAAGLAVERQS